MPSEEGTKVRPAQPTTVMKRAIARRLCAQISQVKTTIRKDLPELANETILNLELAAGPLECYALGAKMDLLNALCWLQTALKTGDSDFLRHEADRTLKAGDACLEEDDGLEELLRLAEQSTRSADHE